MQIYGAGLFSGWGRSERILGECLAANGSTRDKAVVVSKYMPLPWRLRQPGSMLSALRGSVERLGVEQLDVYLVHNPLTSPRPLKVGRSSLVLGSACAAAVVVHVWLSLTISSWVAAALTGGMAALHAAEAEHPGASQQRAVAEQVYMQVM